MTYFERHYKHVTYPTRADNRGLYNAQLGAIHAIASHFTIHKQAAVITMPTGSGKTAVLMTSPFILKAKRVLIITPSRMVRGQIFEDFEKLSVLKGIGVVPNSLSLPKIIEVKSKRDTEEKWKELEEYDVVISTPNCISSSYGDIVQPPADLFDLVLIDEAHHSPSKTWYEILDSFASARKILFTATPFRRDRKEIQGRFIYSYPLAKAYEDKIFGSIRYVPVNEDGADIDNDIAIAKKAEEVFNEDKAANLKHYLMVRTDSKKKAEELLGTYKASTSLRLELIHSGLSYTNAKETLEKLKLGEIDGIICVDMLAEGFNLPNLKIAAIHTPHKSLEVTLQFIGRFARTNASDVGEAKFIAVPSEIEIEGQKIFKEDAIWQEIIQNISHLKITDELETREMIQEFSEPVASDEYIKDLSLYSLNPRNHVKIYKVSDTVNIDVSIDLGEPYQLFYRNLNRNSSVLIFITGEITRPRWLKIDRMVDVKYDLFIVYHDKENNLLYINSSRSVDGLYEKISQALDPKARGLPTSRINKVLKGLKDTNYFNIGMRTIMQANNAESYRILAGSGTQNVIKKGDGRLFRQGHAFCTATETSGKKVNIGFSSASKVWSGSSSQIPKLIAWCKGISKKISSTGDVKTNTGLDFLGAGEVVSIIPVGIISSNWNKEAFDFSDPIIAKYQNDNGDIVDCHLSEFELKIDHSQTNQEQIIFDVTSEGISIKLKFTLEEFYEAVVPTDDTKVMLSRREESFSLVDFFNRYPADFCTQDFSLFTNNELFESRFDGVFVEQGQIEETDWTGTDIKNECSDATNTGISIHDHLKRLLIADAENKVVFYDHGSGEIADFITLKENDTSVIVSLYHCKGSQTSTPSNRVSDIYEVCGQAQRSIIWRGQTRLREKIKIRSFRKPEKFIKGTMTDFTRMFDSEKQKLLEIVIVQPGISKELLNDNISNNLGATNDIVISGGGEKIRVMASK